MPKYEIKQTVDYWATDIEADSPEEAFKIYLESQDSYYDGVVDESIVEQEEDDEDDVEEEEELL